MDSKVKYLSAVTELTHYLSTPHLKVDDLAKFLTLKTFTHLGTEALYIYKLHKDGIVRTVSSFGLSDEIQETWREFPFSLDLPASDAMRSAQIVWLAEPSDWESNYPEISKKRTRTDLQTHICVPLTISGAPSACLGILPKKKLVQTKELESFVTAIAGLVSLYFSSMQENSKNKDFFLTPRQIEILQYMYHGYTNGEIAKELEFSDSTIRHETMRIYQTMHVTGRKQAINSAVSQGLIKNPGARTA